jgi:hypothetical protein
MTDEEEADALLLCLDIEAKLDEIIAHVREINAIFERIEARPFQT